jgi:hypothetical protein
MSKNQSTAPLSPGLAKLAGKNTFNTTIKTTVPTPYPDAQTAPSTTRPTNLNLPLHGSDWETEDPDAKMLDQLKMKMKAVTIGRGVNDEEVDNNNDQRVRNALDNLTVNVEGCITREMRVVSDSPYMENDESGNPRVKHGGWLSTIRHDNYKLVSFSKRKANIGGRPLIFRDTGIKYADGSISTQLVSTGCIIEGVETSAFVKIDGNKGQGDRRMGDQYCRFGMPKSAFAKVIESFAAMRPSMMNGINTSQNYYWGIAGWGVSASACKFTYLSANGWQTTTNQRTVHSMFGGKSLKGIATLAFSINSPLMIANAMEIEDNKQSKFGIKLLRFVLQDQCNTRGPAQVQVANVYIGMEDMTSFVVQKVARPKAFGEGARVNPTTNTAPSDETQSGKFL